MDLTQNIEERNMIDMFSDYPLTKQNVFFLYESGVRLVKRSRKMPLGDCREWALSRLHLEQLDVDKNKIPHVLQPSEVLEPGMLVVYHFPERGHYSHFGVSVQEQGQVLVRSRWGYDGHLYSHPVDKVPTLYGTQADFFQATRRHLPIKRHDILFLYV